MRTNNSLVVFQPQGHHVMKPMKEPWRHTIGIISVQSFSGPSKLHSIFTFVSVSILDIDL